MPFPDINPIAFQLGPLTVHWYALAYVAGFILGWRYIRWLAARFNSPLSPSQIDDFLSWAIIGVLLGGRMGYVLFYNFETFLQAPYHIFMLWEGGMSFHGGLAGIILATYLFARRHKVSFLHLADLVAAAGPIGLFLGRCANFVNGELYGRLTNVPWGVIFPNGGPVARHPSQLYEACLEGIVLFILLYVLVRLRALGRHGLIGGTFLLGYAAARIAVEFFREPDAQLGFLYAGATMGQLLSIPVAVAGIIVILRARKA